MSTGLKIISLLYALVGFLLLFSTIMMFLKYPDLFASLERSGVSAPVYLFTNVVFPVAMIAGGIGLWRRVPWAWWICAVVAGLEVSKKVILVFVAPPLLLGTYPIKENISLLIALVVLAYLFNGKIFRVFHGESLRRVKVLGVLVFISFVGSGLFMWQAKLTMEAMRSNVPFDTAAEK